MPVQNIRTKRPRPGTRWRRKYYETHKATLIELLGGKCVYCGATEKLTFDHVNGDRDWVPSQVHSTKRMRLYEQDFLEDKLQLLCVKCNSSKSDSPEEDESF